MAKLLASKDRDPVRDANRNVAAGVYGLILTGVFRADQVDGVICFTPTGLPPSSSQGGVAGDMVSPQVSRSMAYFKAYNVAVVNNPNYPFADLCRPLPIASDLNFDTEDRVSTPARDVRSPPSSIFQVARRGTRAEVAPFLAASTLNLPDVYGMTPLAWAVARGNTEVVDALLSACADPWLPLDGKGAVYWAARSGHGTLFAKLINTVHSPFGTWPELYVNAAADGGDADILTTILRQPHSRLVRAQSRAKLPSGRALTVLLEEGGPKVAYWVLDRAIYTQDDFDLDVIKAALRHGARVNSDINEGGQPLGVVVNKDNEKQLEVLKLLFDAGATLEGNGGTAEVVRRALNQYILARVQGRDPRRQRAALDLILSRADMAQMDALGRPLVWGLFIPRPQDGFNAETTYDLTPETMGILIRAGLDINAAYLGQTVLQAIVASGGGSSNAAKLLKQLTAK